MAQQTPQPSLALTLPLGEDLVAGTVSKLS